MGIEDWRSSKCHCESILFNTYFRGKFLVFRQLALKRGTIQYTIYKLQLIPRRYLSTEVQYGGLYETNDPHNMSGREGKVRSITLWWEWFNEHGHETCEDDCSYGSKNEPADPCSAHALHITWYKKDNIVCMLTESHNAAIAVTPIIEVAKQ